MTRRIGIAAVFILVAASGVARAQSLYNLPFLGSRSQSGDIRAISLGGNITAVPDTLGIMQLNPAMHAYATRVTFSVGVYGGVDINETAQFSDREGGFKFSSFAFAFRAFSRRVTLGLGYRSKYDAGGGFTLPQVSDLGDEYVEAYTRDGGLQTYPVTGAFNLGRFKLGGFFALERGRMTARWDTDFANEFMVDSFSEQKHTFSGYGWGAGFEVAPFRGLALAGTYEGEVTYDDRVQTASGTIVGNSDQNNPNTVSDHEQPMVLPARLSGSLRVGLGRKMRLYGAGAYSDFTKFKGIGFPQDRLTEEWSASLAIERDNVMGRSPLRASASIEQLPYTLPDGEAIQGFAATLGTGWRLSGTLGKLDLTLQYSQTGTVSANDMQNQSIRLYVGVGGSERWSHERQGGR